MYLTPIATDNMHLTLALLLTAFHMEWLTQHLYPHKHVCNGQ